MSLILVNSSLGEGKDTFFQFFNKHSKKPYENKKFAYKLKQIVALLTGCTVEDLENEDFKNSFLPDIWNKDKKWTYREVLQYFGTELLRDKFNQDVHINAFYADYRLLSKAEYRTGNYAGKCVKCNSWMSDCAKRQLHCIDCINEWNSKNQYPDWLVTDCRFVNEFLSGEIYSAITIKVIRSMSPVQWLNSKYFSEIQFVPNILNIILGDKKLETKIPKMDFVEWLQEHNLILNPLHDSNWKKLIHPSETGLIPFYKAGKFDYIINNDGTLEDFENQVKELVNTIEA